MSYRPKQKQKVHNKEKQNSLIYERKACTHRSLITAVILPIHNLFSMPFNVEIKYWKRARHPIDQIENITFLASEGRKLGPRKSPWDRTNQPIRTSLWLPRAEERIDAIWRHRCYPLFSTPNFHPCGHPNLTKQVLFGSQK